MTYKGYINVFPNWFTIGIELLCLFPFFFVSPSHKHGDE
jgi:hypothetical protein